MQHFLIRLLVALVTFAVGLGASALWSTLRPSVRKNCANYAPVSVKRAEVVKTETLREERFIHGGVLNGKAISKPMPAYPAIAKAARASGTVVVAIVVGEDGSVESARAVSGHPLLQQAAVVAVRQWVFTPTLLSGQPVKVSGNVTVNFVLE